MSDWKVNKEINVGEILTVLSLIGVLIGFFVVQDRRIERNTLVNDQQAQQIDSISKQIESNRQEQKADLNRLDNKLDDIKDLIIKRTQ